MDIERNREQLKEIRRGSWKVSEIKEYFNDKERSLEELYIKSDLPYKPQNEKIRKLLFECLSIHFNEDIKPDVNRMEDFIIDLNEVISKYERRGKNNEN